MSNPFSALNPMNQMNIGSFQNAYNLLVNARNPMQVFQQFAQQNPKLQPIMNMLNQGTNPQQLFMSMCQQRGINPQQFLKNITGGR